MANAVKVLDETVYSDGSGVAGLYEVYGQRFSGIHNGERATVTALGVATGYRSGKAKGWARTGASAVEKRLVGLMVRS